MNDFIASLPKKIDKFIEILIDYNGYVKVLQGLQNTLKIAVLGLIIGIVIGTLIATVRVMPKYKVFPRVLNAICAFYVALFRGTPMVVQLLIFYYVVLPIMGVNLPSVNVAITVFGLNSGAYISEIMRSGIQSVDEGQMEGGRSVGLSFSTTMLRIVIPQAIKNILYTPVFQAIEDGCPELGTFVFTNPHSQNIFLAIQIDSNGNVHCFFHNLPFAVDMNPERLRCRWTPTATATTPWQWVGSYR